MATHPDDLDLYVMGALDDGRRAQVEEHVAGCDQCAAELARQARLELQLAEVAQSSVAAVLPLPVRRGRRKRWVAAAGLAAAASLAAVLAPKLVGPPPAPEPIVVSCPADEHARACLDHARLHGLYVQYPIRRPVPVYETPTLAGGLIAGF
jgi:anti-sigma factor RsiW